ncbi:hypothetical protein CDL12_01746 [Handroanthus impetiginosus]|uniref:Uncharacterized protein n=1 Tax=Handroanthus impetiginosus TaxID=429701 RepID=A0A2G9I793_9LAMI|nr:hypothetical protein CDL12_01746 [Handroanthus impetiginosus]
MGSKESEVFRIFLAMVLLISSEVIARELAEAPITISKPRGDPSPPSHCSIYGCCGVFGSYCQYCCTYAGEKADTEAQAKPHN